MRRQGFLLHRILTFGSRTFKPLFMDNNPDIGNQRLWSDVLFVRDFRRLDRLEPRQLLACAIVAAGIYRAPDLACHVLAEYGRRIGRPLGDEYRDWIATPR